MRRSQGFALPAVLLLISAIGLLSVLSLSLVQSQARIEVVKSEKFRTELAVESGFAFLEGQVAGFFERPEVGAADFTSWTYWQEGSGSTHCAITAGRPYHTGPSPEQLPYLTESNTLWLGTVGDPDELSPSSDPENKGQIDLNQNGTIFADGRPCLARWIDLGEGSAASRGLRSRFAVWVEDESSRLDVTLMGRAPRGYGQSLGELGFPGKGRLSSRDAEKQTLVVEPQMAQFGDSRPDFIRTLREDCTAWSLGYEVMAAAPSFSEGPNQAGVYRGKAKRNLNHYASGSPDQAAHAVREISDWIEFGADGYFAGQNLELWPSSTGPALPLRVPLESKDGASYLRRRGQVETIAASIIDYLDPDSSPTQPEELSNLDLLNPLPSAPPVRLLQDVPPLAFFGAERVARINEVQVIWNCRGEEDGSVARSAVERSTLPNGLFRYRIPVTYRFELWNMDSEPIAATTYAIRTTFAQQIAGSAFGAVGSEPIPPETELVFRPNGGNPIAFAPGEIRVFNFTRVYERLSSEDRGLTWSEFRKGNQPKGHNRQAHVLLDADTGKWLHCTGYLQLSGSRANGVYSAGPGNKGASKGNQVNDPRMVPLRMGLRNGEIRETSYQNDRDWASNGQGSMGRLNHRSGPPPFAYQNLDLWGDRPGDPSLTLITAVRNGPMRSVGELGRIFNPGWTHPAGRGPGLAYSRGVISPFRGGGTLRIGQPAALTAAPVQGSLPLACHDWNLLDLFGTAASDLEFVPIETRGRINLNSPRDLLVNGLPTSNLAEAMTLSELHCAETSFDPTRLVTELKNRLTKSTSAAGIQSWKDAKPLFSVGELSELPNLADPALFHPSPGSAPGSGVLNLSDTGREEVFSRAVGLLTTRSYVYRVHVLAQTLSPTGHIVSTLQRERVVFFGCQWNGQTGEISSVTPQTLYERTH